MSSSFSEAPSHSSAYPSSSHIQHTSLGPTGSPPTTPSLPQSSDLSSPTPSPLVQLLNSPPSITCSSSSTSFSSSLTSPTPLLRQPLSSSGAGVISSSTSAGSLCMLDYNVPPSADHDTVWELGRYESVFAGAPRDDFPSSPTTSDIFADAPDEFDELDIAFEFHPASYRSDPASLVVPAPSEPRLSLQRPSPSSASLATIPVPVGARRDPPSNQVTPRNKITSRPVPATIPRDLETD